MKKRLLGYYDYTVILTYCGMLFALVGIFCVFGEGFLGAVMCLMLAGVCDMFDGAVASTKDRNASEKCFGIQIDSLSDLISFGVLPGLFVFRLMDQTKPAAACGALFILCALIRLAYFNVLEEERQRETTGRRESYLGIPVTTIALVLPAAYLLYAFDLCRARIVFPLLLVLTAAGFLMPFEIKKPQKAGKLVLIAIGAVEMVGLVILLIGARMV